MLGGLFNAVVAPLLFPLAYEYPIAIALGCMLLPKGKSEAGGSPVSADRAGFAVLLDIFFPLLMLTICGLLVWAGNTTEYPIGGWFRTAGEWIADALHPLFGRVGITSVTGKTVVLFAVCAPPCLLCFLFIDRPLRFGLCVAAILFAFLYRDHSSGRESKRTIIWRAMAPLGASPAT